MTANVTINPYLTTVGQGLFNTTSVGLRQGTAYPDPATRYALRGGILAAGETLPMWGGVGIYENVPGPVGATQPLIALGPQVGRATGLTGSLALAGFSVFDQAYGMITSPQSPVPLIGTSGNVMSYALGSRARIAVQCDPILVDLQTGPIGAQVSWDFVNQLLVPYIGTLTITSGSYNNTTGLVTLVMSAPVTFDAGDAIVVSGLGGSGNYADLAGTFTALTASGTSVTYNAGAGIGASAITSGSLTLGSGASSALPVKVLDVQASNCETVTYNAVTGFATWNYNGAAAVIQI
jgi:hypothetical protein